MTGYSIIGRRTHQAFVAIAGALTLGALLTFLRVGTHRPQPIEDVEEPFSTRLANGLDYLATNATTALLIIVAAALVLSLTPGSRAWRVVTGLADAAIVLSLALAFVQVGEALGFYRLHAVAWLPHLPFEILALALTAGCYLEARTTRRASLGQLAVVAVVAVLLLSIGAAIEAFATPIKALA